MLELILVSLFQAAAGDPAPAQTTPEPTTAATQEETSGEVDTGADVVVPAAAPARCEARTGSRLRRRDVCNTRRNGSQNREADEADFDRQSTAQRDAFSRPPQ